MDEKITSRRNFIVNTLYISIVIAIVFLVFKYIISWLLPFFFGLAIAVLFKPLVNLIVEKSRLNKKFVGCIVLLLAYALIGILIFFGGIKLVLFVKNIFIGLPQFYTNTIQPSIDNLSVFLSNFLSEVSPDLATQSTSTLNIILEDIRKSLLSLSSLAISGLGSITAKIPTFVLTFLFTIVSSLFISMNYQDVANFLVKQIPERHRNVLFSIKGNLGATMTKFIRAYIIIMSITFLELTIGFSIIGIKDIVPISIAIAIFDILPVFGAGGILIPWALISLLQMDFNKALGLAIIYVFILVFRNIIEPKVVGSQMGLNPLVTLSAIFLGFKTLGILGMIIVPISVQIAVGLHRSGLIKLWK